MCFDEGLLFPIGCLPGTFRAIMASQNSCTSASNKQIPVFEVGPKVCGFFAGYQLWVLNLFGRCLIHVQLLSR